MNRAIENIQNYLAAPGDRDALRQLTKHALRNAIGSPLLAMGTADTHPTISFMMKDSRGHHHTIRCTAALYCVLLIVNALGHDAHINRRARDSYGYLRVVAVATAGSVLEVEFTAGQTAAPSTSLMPYNLDAQRILFGAGEAQSVHPLSEDRFDLTYENWEVKGRKAKTDEASFVLAVLTPPRGWVSPFAGSPEEQVEAAKVLLMQALENLDCEREMAMATLKARKTAAE
jgi:hypothetical protein